MTLISSVQFLISSMLIWLANTLHWWKRIKWATSKHIKVQKLGESTLWTTNSRSTVSDKLKLSTKL